MLKKTVSILLAAVLVLSAAACAPKTATAPAETTAAIAETTAVPVPAETMAAPEVSAPPAPAKNAAVILYTNDTHTFINNKTKQGDGTEKRGMSFANVAALKKELQEAGENVIVADAGDHVQGSAYGALDQGRAIINLMNCVGYDVATLGNHEFDYGLLRTFSFISKAVFPYVSANFYDVFDGDLALQPFHLHTTADGKIIAFVGISTPETLGKTTPVYFYDENGKLRYKFYGMEKTEELYETVQLAVDGARTQGADYVIALGHTGIDPSSAPWRSVDIIQNTRGIDAYIDGHSHHVVEHDYVKNLDGKEILLTQTGTAFKNIGKMTIAADGTITAELISDYEKRDELVEKAEQSWIGEVEDKLGEKIADLTTDLYINDPATGERLVRSSETNAGDFSADSLYYYAAVERGADVDVAISNGGGNRSDILKGDYRYLEAKTQHPFSNVICAVKVSGQQLLDALEWGSRKVGLSVPGDPKSGECGGFLQVSGVKFTIHTEIPATVTADAEDNWVKGPSGEYRVKDVMVYNRDAGKYEALDLQKMYTVAGNNYDLRNGGDGFTMLTSSELVEEGIGEDYMILASYAKAFDKGGKEFPQIASDKSPLQKYPDFGINYEDVHGAGRITIVK